MVAEERVVGCEYMGIVVVCVWRVAHGWMVMAIRSIPVLAELGARMRHWGYGFDACLGKRTGLWEGWR